MCLAAMMMAGAGLKAQEVMITLNPGWTWISYPKAEAMDIATAFSDFVPMEGDIVKSQYGAAEYYNGSWTGSLQEFTPGLGYMYCSTRVMPVTFVFGGSASQVFVTTSEPMLVTAVSAMGGGEVTVTNGTYIIVKGICWAAHENPTTDDFYEESESGVGTFSISMTGLNISTTYYVRAYAVTANGTVYGEQKSFTTRDGIPTLTTAEVTDITGATATCGGNITDNGGLNVIARGVCWSTSPNPTIANSHTTNGSGNGSFSSSITGLSVSTTYYIRAYATTTAGTSYGEEKTFTTRNGIPTLTTADVTDISFYWATGGGNISDDGGLDITVRGVCWSTMPNPTIADLHTTNDGGLGVFVSTITNLSVNTTFYVRAYATTTVGTSYGEQKCFITLDNPIQEWVDLGLPSGNLWAICNLGAASPEDYGGYFAWGEIAPKDYYDWSTYQHCMGSENTLTKYCGNSTYGYNGFTDNLATLLPEDDAASVNWGADWRIPTYDEWVELRENTTSIWTTQNGVNGRLLTAPNGNSIFLPAAGDHCDGDIWWCIGSVGFYMSSSLIGIDYPISSWYFYFDSHSSGSLNCEGDRTPGLPVRPVRSARQE